MTQLRLKDSLVVVLLPLLAAAACGPRMMWTKPNWNEQEARRDFYECERDARQSGYFGTGYAGAANMVEFQKRCLRAKGYRLVPADETAIDMSK
jgi:hypothetical protein